MTVRGDQITTWMGRTDNPVLAHVHVPQGEVAGAVVLCAPIGREQVGSYRTMRQLGDALARRGLLAVRFTWTGQSDSAPADDGQSLLANWQDDLAAVVEQVRLWGVRRVHLVGLRLGALLLASCADRLDPASLVLWDAVPSGRQFLRHEHLLYTSDGLASPDDGDFHALGYTLPASDADELRALKLKDIELPAVPTARITRGEASRPAPGVDEWTTDEQPAMLETSSMTARVAGRTVSAITAWLDGQDDGSRDVAMVNVRASVEMLQPLHQHDELGPRRVERAHRPLPAEGEREVPAGSTLVRETIVELPSGLPGILTEPVHGTTDQSVLYIAASSEPMDGPSGLWAISAREVAAEGAVALRVDKHGTGELGGALPADPMPYMPGFTEDVGDAARWLTERSGHRPIGVGLCSGTYFQMVRPNGPLFSKVVGINLLAFDRDPARIPDEVAMATDPSHLAAMDGQDTGRPGLKQRLKSGLKENMPQPVWRTLGLLGVAHSPDHFLREAARDTELALYFSPEDFQALAQQRGEAAIAWARSTGSPMQVIVDDELDHGLFGATGRLRCRQVIREEVRRSRRLASLRIA